MIRINNSMFVFLLKNLKKMYSVLHKLINSLKHFLKSDQTIGISEYIYFLVLLCLFIFFYVLFYSTIDYIFIDDFYFTDENNAKCWIEPDWHSIICLVYMLTDLSMDLYLNDAIKKSKDIYSLLMKKYGTLCYLKRRFIREVRKNEYVVRYTSYKFRYEVKEKIKDLLIGFFFYYIPHAMFFIMASSVTLLIGYFIFAQMFVHIPIIDRFLIDFLNREVNPKIPIEEIPTVEKDQPCPREDN